MIKIRRANSRGQANHGWLDSYHTFSFGQYYDPEHMGFRVLRVINEDRVKPDNGFGTHPHSNMEIISYVVSGELEHRDSMGNGSVIKPGEFQIITAGSGITHSEFNPSSKQETHFYQIWILPDRKDLEPRYQQRSFDLSKRSWIDLVVSKDGAEDSLLINQDVRLYRGQLAQGEKKEWPLPIGRYGWIQLVRGQLEINGQKLFPGDGASLEDLVCVDLHALEDSEALFFDLP